MRVRHITPRHSRAVHRTGQLSCETRQLSREPGAKTLQTRGRARSREDGRPTEASAKQWDSMSKLARVAADKNVTDREIRRCRFGAGDG